MAIPAAITYDKITRPYNASLQRSEFVAETENVPGTTQEEGGRTIKTGEALTDVWIDTWIKSRTYQPKTQGFMLNSKGGYIECMDFSIGTGIDMYGNDAYFYDYTEASGGTYIKTATASLNFTRKYYEDQNFIMQKRVGYNSPSVANSDNVFEMFYENPAQGSRLNYIFLGKNGSVVSAAGEYTDVVRIHGNDMFQLTSKTIYGVPDISVAAGDAPGGTWNSGSTRIDLTFKNISSLSGFDPSNPSAFQGGCFSVSIQDPSGNGQQLLIDKNALWIGSPILPGGNNVLPLGSSSYMFAAVYSSFYFFNSANAISFSSSKFQFNASINTTGDVSASGNGIFSGGIVQVGSFYFQPQSITYKNGLGVNETRTFLVA